jgi:aryl-alcohol dehydrogenase-like predicted oxidoreductase
MRYRIFGQRTGLKVAELALDTSMFGRAWGYRAEPGEAGGNLMDSADNYQHGESEQMIGESSPTTRACPRR